jgi:hypothetical protein
MVIRRFTPRAPVPVPGSCMARADGSLRSLLARVSHIDVLVIESP